MITYAKMLIGYKADYSVKWFRVIKGGLIAYKNGSEWVIVDKIKGTR
jgi:hypothetical protein